jgi:hypothetical protein
MGQLQGDFLEAGARVFAVSADSPGQNSAVMQSLALPFPILSDETKENAVQPLGFDDEADPRQISRPGVVIISPEGEVVFRFVGKDYADRPNEEDLLVQLRTLGLRPTSQERPAIGDPEPGEKAMPGEGLKYYFSGAKFATMALRGRHRDVGDEFKDDTKRFVAMVERYLAALSYVRERKA